MHPRRKPTRFGLVVALLSLGPALSGNAQSPARTSPAGSGDTVLDLDAMPALRATNIDAIPTWTGADIKSFLAGKTRLSRMPIHGTQVSYATADGRSYLWYPGNKVVLAGRWRVEDRAIEIRQGGAAVARKSQPRLCYDYGPNSYNPATGRGGGWECTNFMNLRFAGAETRPGDVFGLSRSKAVPFVLSTEPATIDGLVARLKTGATR